MAHQLSDIEKKRIGQLEAEIAKLKSQKVPLANQRDEITGQIKKIDDQIKVKRDEIYNIKQLPLPGVESMNKAQEILGLLPEDSTTDYKGMKIKTYKQDDGWYADTKGNTGLEGTVGPVDSEAKAIAMSKKEIDGMAK